MDTSMDVFFSRIVIQFLELHCETIPGKSVQGQVLFHRFRDCWNEITHGARHPALLGQFRVELTKQGYASSSGKWPRWYDLALRKKKAVKAASKKLEARQEQSIAPVSADPVYREIYTASSNDGQLLTAMA